MKLLEDDIYMNQKTRWDLPACQRYWRYFRLLYESIWFWGYWPHRKFPENKFDLIYLNSPGSSVQIELTYNYDAEPYNVGNGFSHLGVTVSDLEKMHEVCKASAYETGELKDFQAAHRLISLWRTLMAIELK